MDLNEVLLNAAEDGNLLVLKTVVEKGADINAKDSNGKTPIMVAAEMGHSEIVNYLKGQGADINARDKCGDTVLMKASFTTKEIFPGTITDIDGNVYQTVKIGNQLWMAENLKVTHYRNGDPIPNVTDNTEWENRKTGAYCNYDNNINNADIYGKLYNWYAVNDSRNIAPEGWHVPSDAECKTMVKYFGGEDVAGGKLKEAGTTHWKSPNTGATNESGFSGLPGGCRYGSGPYDTYDNMGNSAYFWSSPESNSYSAWYRGLRYDHSEVYRNYCSDKRYGFSVRCLRD